eukprot:CAMPEP_0195512766 /NCGR_PEP_ID=MMETSP0794_2-20130614/4615_1 /TAXON_ID=515487 /ORGANISM="Stephanopyxis turris, Strain CCMP 815" /LENGTH=287 /DNA_ID=CAMNT_0040640631 /DNA_START=117 /DNA_END=980 /DNA_ORIENTATION=-
MEENQTHKKNILSNWTIQSKTFVVTGGTKGIGLATTRVLLAHGADVLICARSESNVMEVVENLSKEISGVDDEGASGGTRVRGVACDISTEEGRATLLSAAQNAYGDSGLHGLINNVGVNIRKPIHEQTAEEYHQIMTTNVDSVYFLTKSFEAMLKQASGGATVVNVASAAGVVSSGTGAAYGMSKGAMIHYTKILACEWAKFNIRVNAVAPWMTMTPMLADAVKDDPSSLDKVKEWTPMHRLCSPEEAAGPIVFLSMDCSSYVTGQCLSVDGGLSAQGFDGPCVTP